MYLVNKKNEKIYEFRTFFYLFKKSIFIYLQKT